MTDTHLKPNFWFLSDPQIYCMYKLMKDIYIMLEITDIYNILLQLYSDFF
jgi:hypothetical protein